MSNNGNYKKRALGMFSARNKDTEASENYIDNSEFLSNLGRMGQGYDNRKAYIANNKEEKDTVLEHLMFIAYPGLKMWDCKNELQRKCLEDCKKFDTVALYECFTRALNLWDIDKGKLFRNYVFDEYTKEAYGKLENYYNDSMGITSTVAEILKRAKLIMSENKADICWAIEELKNDSQYSNTREKTWQAVIDAYNANDKVYLNSMLYSETDGKAVETIERIDIGESPDYLIEEEECDERNSLIVRLENYAIEIGEASNIKRKWMMRGKTGTILKALKYEENENKKKEQIKTYPACVMDNYKALSNCDEILMNRIFDIAFIKYLIKESPNSLETFEGVSFNEFNPGREVTNQCLVDFINATDQRNTPITEQSVSRSLKQYGVSFSGYEER